MPATVFGVEAVEAGDAVVLVDDDVADGEIGEARDSRRAAAGRRGAAAGRAQQHAGRG